MKTEKREYKVFEFDELSEDSKQTAIEAFANINTDMDWWAYSDELLDIAKEYGIHINFQELQFDLERENYVAFETYNHSQKADYIQGIYVEDSKKFIKKAGLDLRECRNIIGNILIDHKHYAGGIISNYVECNDATSEQEEKLQECLEQMLDKMLDSLKAEYESVTSREAIEDTIRANEYEFLEDGSSFNL